MTERRYDLVDALASIPPDVHYDDFITVGQALHHEGYGIDVWRSWASGCNADHKKRLPELDKHWRSFASGNAANPVTGGSLVKLARDHGWTPAGEAAREYVDYDDWSVTFGDDDESRKVVDADAVSEYDARVEPMFPEGHEPEELAAYLRALFDEGDVIRYVIDATYDAETGRAKPGVGVYKRTAGDVLKLLDAGKSIEDALGTLDGEVGAYICINPLDGNYIGNKNVTDCRFALLESDEMPIGQFAAIVRDMNIPVAAMVHSGNKSLHAIVRVGAKDLEQYRSRVEVLYKRAADNGIIVDKANKNASRMSRLPGVMRGGKRQFLAGLSQGAGDWDEWEEWYAEATDDLPDAVSLASALEDLPPLKPALIDGMLRVGHKMLLSGPSKAGKSFALIALCIELARGGSWLGFTCRKSHVMYVNLELDGDSCLNRFADMMGAVHAERDCATNIDVWNLRGKTEPMAKLLPKLVRRCLKLGVEVVVIDPIYKVQTGDENSAGDMAAFANLFDALCDQASVSVIYCHHHSKGFQGGKRAIDRASGSGVFGRDPDAIIDMVELEVDSSMTWKRVNDKICRACAEAVAAEGGESTWKKLPETGRIIAKNAETNAFDMLEIEPRGRLYERIQAAKDSQDALTAWRIEGTLREFPKFAPVNAWFDWPLHVVDPALSECKELGDENAPKGKGRGKKKPDTRKEKPNDDQAEAYAAINAAIAEGVKYCNEDDVAPTRANIRERMGKVNGKQPTKADLLSWTREDKPWCEWVTGGYDEDSKQGDKLIVKRGSHANA